jgi:hypothetical protein
MTMTESNAPYLFRTSSLNFAAYLLAAERLRLSHTETTSNGVFNDFYFEDPKGEGAVLERMYHKGDLEVGARSLMESRAQLLREARRTGAVEGTAK